MPETLRDAFIEELKDPYDGEKKLTKAFPKMAKAATSGPPLAFESHLEGLDQITRLEQVFEVFDEKAKGSRAKASRGVIEQGSSAISDDFDDATPFTLHILAAVAEQEARAISDRTRTALQAARARGTKARHP
jgi:ferritin-like metal-binding protein YciE